MRKVFFPKEFFFYLGVALTLLILGVAVNFVLEAGLPLISNLIIAASFALFMRQAIKKGWQEFDERSYDDTSWKVGCIDSAGEVLAKDAEKRLAKEKEGSVKHGTICLTNSFTHGKVGRVDPAKK